MRIAALSVASAVLVEAGLDVDATFRNGSGRVDRLFRRQSEVDQVAAGVCRIAVAQPVRTAGTGAIRPILRPASVPSSDWTRTSQASQLKPFGLRSSSLSMLFSMMPVPGRDPAAAFAVRQGQ